jgi:uncharacterized membrane protein YhaH (DUF805 family)
MTILQKFFSFKGRLRRRDYWLCSLALGVAGMAIVLPLIFGLVLGLKFEANDPRFSLLTLLLIWPSAAILVKRIHDRDKTGWMAANYWGPWLVSLGLSFVPEFGLGGFKVLLDIATTVVGVWYLIEFGFMDGTQGKNAYGPSPKGVEPTEKVAEVFS